MDLTNLLSEAYQGYKSFQANHPHLGSIIATEVLFVTGDAVSQLIKYGKVEGRKIAYTAKLAPLYGLCLEGLMETGEVVGRHIHNHPLTKGALGPNLWGNFFNVFFFANNTIGEKKDYSVRKLAEHYVDVLTPKKGFWKNFKENYLANVPGKELLTTTALTVTLWNAFQWFNYSCVDEEMRVSTVLSVSVPWNVFLSYLSHVGRKKIAEGIPALDIK